MIIPRWPAPTWIRALTTTRQQGNLGYCEGSDWQEVAQRRRNLFNQIGITEHPLWVDQIHGNQVIEVTPVTVRATDPVLPSIPADGVWTAAPGIPCAILTADCLPVILCDEAGTVVSALHCGWRSLHGGIIHQAVQALRPKAQGKLLAWMGPAIGPQCFEVGAEVRDHFSNIDPQFSQAFKPHTSPGKFLADIYHIARIQLWSEGITGIYGGEYCTYTQSDLFYSYRKECHAGHWVTLKGKVPSNMTTLIWMTPRS